MAFKLRMVSTMAVKSRSGVIEEHRKIELTPWDILELHIEYAQIGLIYHKPTSQQITHLNVKTSSLIDYLRDSLSRTLDFFPPLCGRLATKKNNNGDTCFFIDCNNAGAQVIHAIADGITVGEVMDSDYVPHFVGSFFPFNGVINQEGTKYPLLAVQVTELVDGIFIGCSANHSVVDGRSFWHFITSWSEISRGSDVISTLPILKRHFPFKNMSKRIYIPDEILANASKQPIPVQPLLERVFHLTKENIAKLKAKANHEMNTTTISSLQSILAHVWQSVIRCRRLDYNDETTFEVPIDMRGRLNPPLSQCFFGNAIYPATITFKTGELLDHGLGWVALQIKKMIADHDHEKLNKIYKNWGKDPEITKLGDLPSNYFMMNNDPRFDVYGNDFGWGKPIAFRTGTVNNILDGKITVSAHAVEEGSMIAEVCLSPKTIRALEEDATFREFAMPTVGSEKGIRARI